MTTTERASDARTASQAASSTDERMNNLWYGSPTSKGPCDEQVWKMVPEKKYHNNGETSWQKLEQTFPFGLLLFFFTLHYKDSP